MKKRYSATKSYFASVVLMNKLLEVVRDPDVVAKFEDFTAQCEALIQALRENEGKRHD